MSGKIFVTGHRGLLGSALRRALSGSGCEVITAGREQLDLRDSAAVSAFLNQHRPAAIIHAAARNGGLLLHQAEPVAMREDNLAIATNVIRAAQEQGTARLIFVSSACVYTATGDTPQMETAAGAVLPEGLLAGYAFAKIEGMKLCDAGHAEGRAWCTIIPCNLYGPGDNYHPDHATVVPGMMRRMHEAVRAQLPEYKVWGSGRQTRELLHADDLAAACILLLNTERPPARVNCSTGTGTPMMELALNLKEVTRYDGGLITDPSKPEGSQRPMLDGTVLRCLGWAPRISLREGLEGTYAAFRADLAAGRLRG